MKDIYIVWWGKSAEDRQNAWIHSSFVSRDDWVIDLHDTDEALLASFNHHPWTLSLNYTELPSGYCGECEGPVKYLSLDYLCESCRK